jgi:hypothetical protein
MIADTFNKPDAKHVDGDKPSVGQTACTCYRLGRLPRGHNHHPLCDIWEGRRTDS